MLQSSQLSPIYVGCPVQLIGEIFWDCICVDKHLRRFEGLAPAVPHFEALIRLVVPDFVKRCLSFSWSLAVLATVFLAWVPVSPFFASIFPLFPRNAWYSGYSFSHSGTGNYFVTLAHRWNIGDNGISLFPSDLFTVFSHFSHCSIKEKLHFEIIRYVDIIATMCSAHCICFYELRSTIYFKLNSIFDISINTFSDVFNFLYSNS